MSVRRFRLFLLILLIVYSFPLISALGVSPAKIEINFEPGLSKSFEMGVYNSPPKNQDVKIYVGFTELDSDIADEFKDIVVLEKESLSFTEQETKKSLNITFNFPNSMSISGVHELRVGAIKKVSSEEEGVNVIAGNEIRVLINVSEKYASGGARVKILKILSVSGEDVEEGGKSNISVLVKSDSDIRLEGVFAKIDIIKDGNVIATLETNKINLQPGEENSLSIIFDTKGIKPGVLNLNAEVFYDSKSVKASGTLRILEKGKEIGIGEEEKGFSWWIIIIIILLLFIILFLVFLLFKRRKEETTESANKIMPQSNQIQ